MSRKAEICKILKEPPQLSEAANNYQIKKLMSQAELLRDSPRYKLSANCSWPRKVVALMNHQPSKGGLSEAMVGVASLKLP